MSNVAYLFIVIGLSLVGLVILWLRNRPSSSPRSSVEQFSDKMRALAPESEHRVKRHRSSKKSTRAS